MVEPGIGELEVVHSQHLAWFGEDACTIKSGIGSRFC